MLWLNSTIIFLTGFEGIREKLWKITVFKSNVDKHVNELVVNFRFDSEMFQSGQKNQIFGSIIAFYYRRAETTLTMVD